MTGSCYKPSEGFCERVVIGSQARLRIWCLCAYGFESLRSHKKSSLPGCFFCAAKGQSLRIPSPLDSPGARGMLSPISPSVASLLRSHKNSSRDGCFFCAAKGQSLRIPVLRTAPGICQANTVHISNSRQASGPTPEPGAVLPVCSRRRCFFPAAVPSSRMPETDCKKILWKRVKLEWL